MNAKKPVYACLAALLLCSCAARKTDPAILELDRTLDRSAEYKARFEAEMDSLKRAFPADASDSLRWEFANRMYTIYRYYDIDTVVRYVNQMEYYSQRTGDPDQCSLTNGARVRQLRSKDSYAEAVALFESMDTTGLKRTTVRKYYSTGVTLYMHILDFKEVGAMRPKFDRRLRQLREEYEDNFYDSSVHCRYMTALGCRDYGDYRRALEILYSLLDEDGLTLHERALISYYISTVYARLGDSPQRKEWLIKSSMYGIMVPVKDYGPLYLLSTMLMEEKDYNRAARYMEVALQDALSLSMTELLVRNSAAYAAIAQATNESARAQTRMLFAGMMILIAAVLLVMLLLAYTLRQRRRLKKAYDIIASINGELKDANQIKDNYVARYMKLSTYYIRQVDETRKELRRVAKSGGMDAVMSLLRSPLYADEEYKRFYKIFDETFIGLFPHFVDKVNELLPPEARFYLKGDNELNTELRILAVIRLGITKSPEIAEVLNCAVRTVYKYRFNLRSIALCPKDEFEERICKIDF